jgi:hypothetical protein
MFVTPPNIAGHACHRDDRQREDAADRHGSDAGRGASNVLRTAPVTAHAPR